MAHEALEEIIGRNIARYREVAGLTQATLAEKIGISTAFVSRVERGQKRMKVETLYATAKALNVSVDAGQSDEYLEGIERMIRVCIEEFEPKEKFPSGS